MIAVVRPSLAGLAIACWLLAVLLGEGLPARAQEQEAHPSTVPELGWQRIPAGTFRMGCVQGDEYCAEEEAPRHTVRITKPFDLMTTEITVAMFSAYIETAGGQIPEQPAWNGEPDQPAVNITWDETLAFCEWGGGRLPTEAEWEYAARGGRSNQLFPWGDSIRRNYANYGADNCCGGIAVGADRWEFASPVGSFPSTGFGLEDIAGNVWEWVADWYGDDYYAQSPDEDPPGPASGQSRVLRGGSFGGDSRLLRSSFRGYGLGPTFRGPNVGGRCARDVSP
jgi:formylglycine-generating enzyme required for sulfatase activity